MADIGISDITGKATALFDNPAFRAAVGSSAFRDTLGSSALKAAVGSSAFRDTLGSSALKGGGR